jgi:hypothetical protein
MWINKRPPHSQTSVLIKTINGLVWELVPPTWTGNYWRLFRRGNLVLTLSYYKKEHRVGALSQANLFIKDGGY